MTKRTRATILVSLLLVSCGREKAETTSATGDEGESTSSGAPGDGVTDGGGATSSSSGSTTTTATTGDAQESSTSTSDGDTSGCQAYVSKFIECVADDDPDLYREALAACEMGVSSYNELYGAECVDAVEAYQVCFASLTCVEIEGERACAAEASVMTELCASEPGPLCAAYEAKVVACTGDPDSNSGEECQTQIDTYDTYYGEACKQAAEDFYACLTSLPCESSGCESEGETILSLCS